MKRINLFFLSLLAGLLVGTKAWGQTEVLKASSTLPTVGSPEYQYYIHMSCGDNKTTYWQPNTVPGTSSNRGKFAFYKVDGVEGAYHIYSLGNSKWITYAPATAEYSEGTKSFAKYQDSRNGYWKIEKVNNKDSQPCYQIRPYYLSSGNVTWSNRYLNYYQGVSGYGGNTIGIYKQGASEDNGSGWALEKADFIPEIEIGKVYTLAMIASTNKLGDKHYLYNNGTSLKANTEANDMVTDEKAAMFVVTSTATGKYLFRNGNGYFINIHNATSGDGIRAMTTDYQSNYSNISINFPLSGSYVTKTVPENSVYFRNAGLTNGRVIIYNESNWSAANSNAPYFNGNYTSAIAIDEATSYTAYKVEYTGALPSSGYSISYNDVSPVAQSPYIIAKNGELTSDNIASKITITSPAGYQATPSLNGSTITVNFEQVTTYNITYQIKKNEQVVWSQVCKVNVGDTYPVPTSPSDFIILTGYPTTGAPTDDETIDISYTHNYPFTLSSSYADATWYTMTLHTDKYYMYDPGEATSMALTRKYSNFTDGDKWCFTGDYFDGIKILNKGKGADYILSASKTMSSDNGKTTFPLLKKESEIDETTDNKTWDAFTSTYGTNGFYLSEHGLPGYKFNRRDEKLAFWSGADQGSTLMVYEYSEQEYTIIATDQNDQPVSGGGVVFNGANYTSTLTTGIGLLPGALSHIKVSGFVADVITISGTVITVIYTAWTPETDPYNGKVFRLNVPNKSENAAAYENANHELAWATNSQSDKSDLWMIELVNNEHKYSFRNVKTGRYMYYHTGNNTHWQGAIDFDNTGNHTTLYIHEIHGSNPLAYGISYQSTFAFNETDNFMHADAYNNIVKWGISENKKNGPSSWTINEVSVTEYTTTEEWNMHWAYCDVINQNEVASAIPIGTAPGTIQAPEGWDAAKQAAQDVVDAGETGHEKSLTELQTIANTLKAKNALAVTINTPVVDKFYRLKSAYTSVGTYYVICDNIVSTDANFNGRAKMITDATDTRTIYKYTRDNKFESYYKDVKMGQETWANGADGCAWTYEKGAKVANTLAMKNGSDYLYGWAGANKGQTKAEMCDRQGSAEANGHTDWFIEPIPDNYIYTVKFVNDPGDASVKVKDGTDRAATKTLPWIYSTTPITQPSQLTYGATNCKVEATISGQNITITCTSLDKKVLKFTNMDYSNSSLAEGENNTLITKVSAGDDLSQFWYAELVDNSYYLLRNVKTGNYMKGKNSDDASSGTTYWETTSEEGSDNYTHLYIKGGYQSNDSYAIKSVDTESFGSNKCCAKASGETGNVACWGAWTNYAAWTIEETSTVDVDIKDVGWATYYPNYNAKIVSGNATAYYVNVNGSNLVKTEASCIQSYNGVLLKSNEGGACTVTFASVHGNCVDDGTKFENNKMVGTTEEGGETFNDAGYTYYILTKGIPTGKTEVSDAVLGFFWDPTSTSGTSAKCGQYKAVLRIPEKTQIKGFSLDDDPTSISDVDANVGATEIYNLSGQKLNKLQKGINIVNGKKVLY